MRRDVTFKSQGVDCCAWLYMPDGWSAGKRAPAVVMAHGFCAVKEMCLDGFARKFAEAGLAALVFDYRCFGGSAGEPRNHLIAQEQLEDYRNAITWLSDQPSVDPDRIGVWGTSFSGGLVQHVAAFDRRVKAAVAQTPSVLGPDDRRVVNPERFDRTQALFLQKRIERYRTGAVEYLPVVAPGGQGAALAAEDAYDWFTGFGPSAPSFRNEITIESFELSRQWDPSARISMIAPTPLLMIAAERDSLIPIDYVRAAFARAGEPKRLVTLDCGHFDVYATEPWFSRASGAAVEWFTQHLSVG